MFFQMLYLLKLLNSCRCIIKMFFIKIVKITIEVKLGVFNWGGGDGKSKIDHTRIA